VDEGGTPRPVWRRPRLVGPTIAAVVLLTAGGIFAAVASKGPGPKPSAAAPAAPLNTVPFTGTYRVDYGPATDLDGKPVETAPPGSTVTWGVRSACRPAGCVATASRLGGESFVSGMVFDDVGGRWVAVVLVSDPASTLPLNSGQCSPCNHAPTAHWPANGAAVIDQRRNSTTCWPTPHRRLPG
jgi:serine/threonine-protein kinase